MHGMPTDYWGKFKESSSGCDMDSSWLPLTFHLLDVGLTFRELLDNGYGKALANIGGTDDLTEVQKQRLCLLAFLHDIGKGINDFQGQIFGDYGKREFNGHTRVACSLFTDKLIAKLIDFLPDNFADWYTDADEDGEELFSRMLLATIGHHGEPVKYGFDDRTAVEAELSRVNWSNWRYTDIDRLLSEMENIMRSVWPRAFEDGDALRADPAFMQEFNGLLTLADWMASDDRYFRFDAGKDWSERAEFARATAAAMLTKAGRNASPKSLTFQSAFGFEPNAMQAALIEVSGSLYQ